MIEQFRPTPLVEGDLPPQWIPRAADEYTASAWAPVAIGEVGPRTYETLLAVPIQEKVGDYLPTYSFDLYERLHISIASLSLGNVIGLQTRSAFVWNAYTRAQPLAAITLQNTEGITLTGGDTPPTILGPLEEVEYIVQVGTSGPPTIDATITWDFAPYDLTLTITGSRVTAWTFSPDWSAPVTERIEWKTDVLQSFDANEQRGALRIGARKSYEFESFFTDKQRRFAESLLWGWGARTWALPVWPDGQDLGATLPVGSTAIAIDTTARDFEAGALAVVMADPFTYEVLEVDSVNPSSVALKRGTTFEWSASARLYPARLARVMDSVNLPRWNGQASGLRVVFDISTPVDYTANAGATTYRGRPVLTTRPNWVGGLDMELTRKLAELDAITGGRAYDDESEIPTQRQRMRWTMTTKAEQDTFRKMLYALKGRRGSIWVPTWCHDLKIAALIVEGAAGIDVEWCAYTQHLNQDVGRRDIRIELTNGQVLYRRITGSSEVDDNTERLVIDSQINQLIQVDEVVQISFMTLSRLDSDAVELAHWTGEVFDSTTTFRSFNNDV